MVMKTTETTSKIDAEGPAPTLHLVTPSSQGYPLCGEPSPDALIGSYCEHLEGERWVREVFGKDGKAGKPCPTCLASYPSMLCRRPTANDDGWPLFVRISKWHFA